MNESIDNLVAYQPSPDALAEISVETNNYAADTGNVAGAVISNVIKSGSNLFRGQPLRVLQEQRAWTRTPGRTTARTRPSRNAGRTSTAARWADRWSRNKLFFFGNYQGTRFNAPGSETISVAPEAWRRGDLSSVTSVIRDPLTGRPFAGNQIPIDRISPIARAILDNTALYPLPNRSVTGVTGNYVGETLTTIRAQQGDVRVDWNASPKDKVFGRFSFAGYQSINNTRAFPLLAGSGTDAPFRNLAVNWNRVFSSVARQRGPRRLQPDHDRLGYPRLGRHRKRQRDLRDRGRPADPRPQLDRLGQRPDVGRRRRERHEHARQDLSDQREAHLAQRAPGAEVRRPAAALRPAALLRRQQRPARHCSPTAAPSPDSRSPISCSTRWRARGAAARRSPGRTSTTGQRSTSRTTSRSRPRSR